MAVASPAVPGSGIRWLSLLLSIGLAVSFGWVVPGIEALRHPLGIAGSVTALYVLFFAGALGWSGLRAKYELHPYIFNDPTHWAAQALTEVSAGNGREAALAGYVERRRREIDAGLLGPFLLAPVSGVCGALLSLLLRHADGQRPSLEGIAPAAVGLGGTFLAGLLLVAGRSLWLSVFTRWERLALDLLPKLPTPEDEALLRGRIATLEQEVGELRTKLRLYQNVEGEREELAREARRLNRLKDDLDRKERALRRRESELGGSGPMPASAEPLPPGPSNPFRESTAASSLPGPLPTASDDGTFSDIPDDPLAR